MSSSVWKVSTAIALFVAGVVVGSWRGAHVAQDASGDAGGTPRASAAGSEAIDYARIESIVKRTVEARCEGGGADRIAELTGGAPPAEASSGRPGQNEEDEEERLLVVAQATQRVEAALSRRVWTAEDASAMQDLVPSLQPEERDKLAIQLASAHNAAQIKIQVFPPF